MQSLLLQIEGALVGARACLADFEPNSDTEAQARADEAVPLTLIGATGVPVGSAAMRELAAKALMAAPDVIGANDSETLGILMHVGDPDGLLVM